MKGGWVYILTNKTHNVLYIGVTASLKTRIHQHRQGEGSSFTRKYRCHKLVLAEPYPTIGEAIAREKAMKQWKRAWKEELIGKDSPNWEDLFDRLNT